MRINQSLAAAVLAVGASFCLPAHALLVEYQATDLPDVVSGQDLWRMDYWVHGPLAQDYQVSIEEPGIVQFANADSLDLSLYAASPDPSLPSNALLALAPLAPLAAGAELTGFFEFVWGGANPPGAQAFEIVDPFFNPTGDTGVTVLRGSVAAIPEPGTYGLMALGLGLLALRRRPRRAA